MPQSAGIRIKNSSNVTATDNDIRDFDVGVDVIGSKEVELLRNEISTTISTNERDLTLTRLGEIESSLEEMNRGNNDIGTIEKAVSWLAAHAELVYNVVRAIPFIDKILHGK